jgi:membrane-associated protein
MEFLRDVIDLFLHIDQHLGDLIAEYGTWTYIILFVVVFCETGLVVTPVLPGDSLLFTAGALAALGSLNVYVVSLLLMVAAILGDMANYWAGHYFGAKIFKPDARFLKTEYLDRTYDFYEKYGPKTIVIARFVPFVRTFAPFVAGMGKMRYPRFFYYNVTGAVLWVVVCVAAGYIFGNIPVVKEHFSLVILGIIVVSLIPAILNFIKARKSTVGETS